MGRLVAMLQAEAFREEEAALRAAFNAPAFRFPLFRFFR